jgi:ATP-dependent RNA helicase DDX19/DBP5
MAIVKSLADRISHDETTPENTKEPENTEENTKISIKPERDTEDNDTIPDTNLIVNKYEVTVKLQDMQADPTSPLYSVKSFDELGL